MKLIIDTDMGIDDAVALLMALAYPGVEIRGITTVMGNIALPQVVHNAGAVLDIAAAPTIPIYQGCATPLLQYQPDDATYVHGNDGLGGAAPQKTDRLIEKKHAALALIDLVRHAPGEITLLTLGPLTNVALAIRLYPDFLNQLGKLVVMGGAVNGYGNMSAASEFNIAVDPEAAALMFNACSQAKKTIHLISWEATLDHGILFSSWDSLIQGQTPVTLFVQKMTAHIRQNYGDTTVLWPDPLAAAVALEPTIVTEQETRFVAVEPGHNLGRGQTIVDRRRWTKSTPNTNIINKVNLQRFQELLKMGIQQKGGQMS